MPASATSEMATQGAQWLQGMKEAAMSLSKGKEKGDDDEQYNPFAGISKSAVLQECRCFNDREINARKCVNILTKVLWLLAQGEKLTALETTDIFFGATKLLQNKDQQLRRMIYLILKELKPKPEEVLIVVATLTKDMNSKIDLNRANAIRVLGAIIAATDPTLLVQIERHLKQALVDKNCFVAASALVAGIHLMPVNGEVVRRWVNEVQHRAPLGQPERPVPRARAPPPDQAPGPARRLQGGGVADAHAAQERDGAVPARASATRAA